MSRIFASLILPALLCLGTTGCALFKKDRDGNRPTGMEGGRAPAQFPGANDPLLNSSKPPAVPANPVQPASTMTNPGALLAGRVIDGFNRPPPGTSVRWVSLDEKDANPIEVAVNADGYFTIQGLKPNTHYKLIAQGKNGDKTLGGVTYTMAPNIRVLIQVKEEFGGNNNTNVGGGKDSLSKPEGTPRNAGPGTANPPSTGWTPGNGDVQPASVEHDLPVKLNVPANGSGNPWPPTLQIPRPPSPPPLKIDTPGAITFPPPNSSGPEARPGASGPARVPSCVLVGKQLINFALGDINGETWEFKSHRRGKLVLLDFWGSHCLPCRETMPRLAELQTKYGPQGLEVIGIAYENSGTPHEQAYKVLDVCKKTGAHYRQLLGAGANCPVRNQFSIRFVPTLVLVDESGWILWRHEGRLEPAQAGELERLMQRRLGARPF